MEELKQLGNILKSNWGYGAIYPGTFPTDWVNSSGMVDDGYCKAIPTMLTSMNVLKSSELKKMKINREYDLLNRSINYHNHCGTHKCRSYCLVITIITVLYNIINHKHVQDADIVTENSIRYAK